MNSKVLKDLLEPQFGKLGKSTGEQLWIHHYNTWNITSNILSFLEGISDKTKNNIEIAALIHDIGKMSDEHQAFYKGESKKKPTHRASKEKIIEYLNPLISSGILELDQEDVYQIFEIAFIHHSVSESDIREATTSRFGVYTEILRRADRLASAESLDSTMIHEIREKYKPFFDLTYFRNSRFPSPTASLLEKIAIGHYVNKGWKILVRYSNGIVFIGKRGTNLPNKSEIINDFYKSFLEKILYLQNPTIKSPKGNFLVGSAIKYPKSFILAHKDYFIERLKESDNRYLYFIKLVSSLIKLDPDYNKMTESLPYLKIAISSGGSRGVPEARRKWSEISGSDIQDLSEIFKEIFNRAILSELIPIGICGSTEIKPIKDYTADELFNILVSIAEKYEQYGQADILQKEFIGINFNLEEEVDFEKYAKTIFKKYKDYKLKGNPQNGICERCGCPVSIQAHNKLYFSDSWGFSQVSSKKDVWQASCNFCAYDNIVLKRENKDIPLTLIIESKTRPIIENNFLKQIINRFYNGIFFPSKLVEIINLDESTPIPFIHKIRIPDAQKEYITNDKFQILPEYENEFGFQMSLPLLKDNQKPNVKNRKAQLRPLYYFLSLLGYRIHIGETEMKGLFGEELIPTLERYYFSLAVIILRRAIESNQAFLKAERLLDRIPSVAISIIGSDDKNILRKLSNELIIYFFQLISKSNQILNLKEDYRMSTLLEDAAFFAENIPKFCWSSEDWGKWFSNHSKHAATKPIAAAMNELLQGRSVEESLARFLSFIRENIVKDKTSAITKGKGKDKLPTTDESELKTFLQELRKKLEKYEAIRKANITDFIRIKNALMSAIFVYERYPILIEGENRE